MGMHLLQFLLLFTFTRSTNAFVYSCNEVKYKILDKVFEKSTDYACVITEENYIYWDQLKNIYVESGTARESFAELARKSNKSKTVGSENDFCIKRGDSNEKWTVGADGNVDLDCSWEFSLIFKSTSKDSESTGFIVPSLREVKIPFTDRNNATQVTIVSPTTGIWLTISDVDCGEKGSVILNSGAGINESEEAYTIHSWRCEQIPTLIYSFNTVFTLYLYEVSSFTFFYSAFTNADSTTASRVFVFSDGRSDATHYNIMRHFSQGARPLSLRIFLTETTISSKLYPVTVNYRHHFNDNKTLASLYANDVFFENEDSRWADWAPPNFETLFSNPDDTYTAHLKANKIKIEFFPERRQASDISKTDDFMFYDISIDKEVPTTTPVPTTTTTTAEAPTTEGAECSKIHSPYCNCLMNEDGSPSNWTYNDIWLDIVVILDTSESMGKAALDDAGALIESFISDGAADFLITDTTQKFYSRVGVISMADTPTVLYSLNMTKYDAILDKALIKEGVTKINVTDAFEAALIMFEEGLKTKPERAIARRVIYYMTVADPKVNHNPINQFKASQGVIIVNDFLHEGEVAYSGLRELASDGFYIQNDNYNLALQSFCKANCFCKPEKNALGGPDKAIVASGGCYHGAPAGVPYNKAKTVCTRGGGKLIEIHDEEKARFATQLMTKAPSTNFWISFKKSDEGGWKWEDESTNTYENWEVGQPSEDKAAKCAYVNTSSATLAWSAGSCLSGFPYVCEYTPCSAGYMDC